MTTDGFYNYNDYPEFEGSGHLTAVKGSRYLTMYDITRYRLLCSQLLVSLWKKKVLLHNERPRSNNDNKG